MRLKQLLFVSILVAGLVGAACLSKEGDTAGVQMSDAAARLVGSFNDDQKSQGVFAFEDKERTNWNFIPLQDKQKKATRKGLRFERMTAEQKDLSRALLRAGTSGAGFLKATTIMSLEAVLADLEKNGAMVRNPGWYFVSIFGTPSKAGKWGWRIEGHHLSLNFVVERGKIVSSTPAFFGANPADIKAGPKKGQRTLAEAEDLAKELFAALGDGQRKSALQPKQFAEIEQGKAVPHVGAPKGLPASQMNESQRKLLGRLVQAYADRMPAEVNQAQMAEVKAAGSDKIHFAFAQDMDKPGKPYTYRVQGPTFVIEFLNVQSDSAGNPANHIHSSWRNLKGDFGIVAD
jgi:3-methyladenine DNA glycosylase Tag